LIYQRMSVLFYMVVMTICKTIWLF